MSLREKIAGEIESRGPMPFDRFMSLALYDPEGFFGGLRLRSEKAGDFLTSPEVSALFGETLARFVSAERERIGEPFQVVEVAAGSGTLLGPLLRVAPTPAVAVEVSPGARAALGASLPAIDVVDRLPRSMRGVVIANELIDNMPMALAQKTGDGWRERWVGWEGERFAFIDAPPREEVTRWLDEYAGEVPDGGWVEAQLEAARWLEDVLSTLKAGSVLILDYGDTAANLVPRRADGTLRTYRAHHLGPHPLDEPGETDITADVNFTALEAVARRAGADVTVNRQDDFLNGLGLRQRLSEIRQEELEAARAGDTNQGLRARSLRIEAETLLHPRGLGDFRVLVCRV
ncbi:MAG: SAM-dependent methyltransferase [Acidimicrobiia bacterium]